MIIELPSGDVKIDGKPYIKDFRINIAPEHQMRCKFVAIVGKEEIPFDIIIYNWDVKLSISTIKITVVGLEKKSNNQIRCEINYKILQRKFNVTGKIGSKKIDVETNNHLELFQVINDIFLIRI